MANKCLLSLLVVISITTLCRFNVEGLSCYVGEYIYRDKKTNVGTQTCPDDSYLCYTRVMIRRKTNDADTIITLGCTSSKNGVMVCKENNCNKPY
jgi:hypothetical protein